MSDLPVQKCGFCERMFRKKKTGFMSYFLYLLSQEIASALATEL